MTDSAMALVDGGKVSSSSELTLSFGDVELQSKEAANICVGERNVDLFFNPNNFPILCGDTAIDMGMRWTEDSDTMTVKRIDSGGVDWFATMDVTEMTGYQRTITLLYLVGRLTKDVS